MAFQLQAQRLITGKIQVLNTKTPVDQVDVSIYKGTSTTATNKYGYFQLTVEDGDSLLITHPEYKIGLIRVPDVDVFVIYLESLNYYPSFLDGEYNLYAFLQQNLKYPRQARSKKIEGLLYVELQVDSVGSMIGCKALNDIGGNCAEETIATFLKIKGKWSVSHETKYFIFPIVFKMDLNKKKVGLPNIDISHGKVMETIFITASSSTEFY